MTDQIKIGTGAAYARDRITPAVELANNPALDYLVFECLAERTIANAQLEKIDNQDKGYNPLLKQRWEAVLSDCIENNIKIVTNMGAANPDAALNLTCEIASDLGLSDISVASVSGSDVRDQFEQFEKKTQNNESIKKYEERSVSANAYMGVEGIMESLANDADIVITGRVADPSLFLGPLCHEFDWDHTMSNSRSRQQIGQGTVCGHLMECAGQITGGYFADPDYKDVDDLATLGFPIATVEEDGSVEISKLPNTGGEITVQTCKEQLLYEVHDPSAYITPDAVADFSKVTFERTSPDRVHVSGAKASSSPETLKVNIGYEDSIVGEGQISYAGPGAAERAELAAEIVQQRLDMRNLPIQELHVDLIGQNSLHGNYLSSDSTPPEVRLRVSGKCKTRDVASEIGREVQTLYTNGPSGGGGATMNTKRVLGIVSTLIDREYVSPTVDLQVVQ